ncbi:hypothetical protein DMUE_5456 [Dictyocoela muelleri]|nr:hypothetical protein DMUE_5456 [Dictyocoela muelleri]
MLELSKTNADNVLSEVLNMVSSLSNGNIIKLKMKLVLSDIAPYALKAGRLLKDVIPSLNHISCYAHIFHLVYETLRKESGLSDSLFADIKHIVKKNKKNQGDFYSVTGLKLPNFPIITRLGLV